MLAELVKLAYVLDKKGEYELARSVDEVVQSMAERVGLNMEELVSLADYFDAEGEVELANRFDDMVQKLAKKKKTPYKTWKGKGEKPPKGAEHKAPKEWWDEQVKKVKSKNPDYPAKRVSEIVGDIWDNQLSDKKRQQIYNRYGKKKSPNK